MDRSTLIYKWGEFEVYEIPRIRMQDYDERTPNIDSEVLSKMHESFYIKIGNENPHNLKASFIKHLLGIKEDDQFVAELERHNHGLTEKIKEHQIPLPDLRVSLIMVLRAKEHLASKQKTEETKEIKYRP